VNCADVEGAFVVRDCCRTDIAEDYVSWVTVCVFRELSG
jgi:hypothetical protein